ncbi:hypothetical protein WK07_16735 [Burkholderia multivorans]|uniref:hypothetical protein n=1 Tax=Burkholderia multivorans TaxID=87883 RepID=UPI000751DEEA|nr:hypothetical protein [Burkholderia multivorans]KVQ78508.1 hypothetical protein WK07_16735 [Burkholderia multivorans]
MDEREMFEATLVELTKRDEETFDKPFPNDDINVLWAIWKEARRTTPDRDAIIEECAQAASNARLDLIWKGERLMEAKEVGYVCAAAIRDLKTTPTAASREEGNG